MLLEGQKLLLYLISIDKASLCHMSIIFLKNILLGMFFYRI